MITHYFKSVQDKTLQTLENIRTGVWTHAVAPTDEELSALVTLYGLDETIVSDIKDFFEVPRFEQEGTASYFFTRYPYDVKDMDIDTAPILIVVGESFILTIAQQEVPFLSSFIERKRECSTTQKTKLFLQFLSALTSTYDRKLTKMRKNVNRDMGRLRNIRGHDIQRLVFYEQELSETISAIIPTNAWIQQLTKGNHIQMFTDDRELMDDLLIANAQLVDSAKSILHMIQNIRSATEAILSQNLNNTMRMLTAFTIVLTIPTLVSSLYGMNVGLPLQTHPYAFWLIIVLIVTAMTLTIYFFMQNRWI